MRRLEIILWPQEVKTWFPWPEDVIMGMPGLQQRYAHYRGDE